MKKKKYVLVLSPEQWEDLDSTLNYFDFSDEGEAKHKALQDLVQIIEYDDSTPECEVTFEAD